jgi:hypothetical protein
MMYQSQGVEMVMFDVLSQASWSPYMAGAGIGVLSCLALVLADRALGCSLAFVKARGMIGKVISAEKTMKMEYYQDIVPQVDWAFMIVPGIVIGAFLSSFLSGTFHFVWVPALWGSVFGGNVVLRVIVALAGGVLLGFGARWAGGCTSGHGISGSIQLSLASMVTAACFFAGGIAVALLLFRVIGVLV